MGFSPFSKFGRSATAFPMGFGKTFFVHSSGTGAYQRLVDTFGYDEDGVNRVYTTIAAAVAVCTASQGDTIYVLEGKWNELMSQRSAMRSWIISLITGAYLRRVTSLSL